MRIGEYNELTILRFTTPGAYLGDELGNDVLLPGKYTTPDMEEGSIVKVFVYKDSEDRVVATTEDPLIYLDSFAFLRVKEVNAFGAFLDWGLEKDLMVPFKEQNKRMEEEKSYLVTLRLDDATDRLFASTKVNRYLEECQMPEIMDQEVNLLICDTTDLGVKVIVNDLYWGMVYRNDISRSVRRGQRMSGYVYFVRQDGKLDVRFEKPGFEKFDEAAERLLDLLKQKKVLRLSDKSSPDDIREQVGMSKKLFKQSVGKLYKARLITVSESAIVLA